jgi:hypothetical protein
MGASAEDAIHQWWETFDRMELELQEAGVPPTEVPTSTRPKLTAEILATPNYQQFTEIYSIFGEWFGYIVDYHARVRAKLIEIVNEMNDIEVMMRENMREAAKAPGVKKLSQLEMSDKIESLPQYRELKRERQKWDQQRIMLDGRLEQTSRDLKIISRQVEIRGQEMERQRIMGNMPRRQHVPRGS